MCKSYHSTGFCPYGTRCHFIHNAEDIEKDSSEEDSLDVKPFEGLKIRYVGRKLSRPCLVPSWGRAGTRTVPGRLVLSYGPLHWIPPLKYFFSAIHLIHLTGHQNPFPEIQIQIPIQNLTLQNLRQNLTVTRRWTQTNSLDQKVDYLEHWKVVWQKIQLLLHLIRSDRWKPIPALNRFGQIIILHR